MSKYWIQKAIEHPGALKKTLGVTKKGTISKVKLEKTASKGSGVTAKRANLALTLEEMHKPKKELRSNHYQP